MPKRKKNTKVRKDSTTDWIRRSRSINDDIGILRKLILDTFQIDSENQLLNGSLFEKTYKLGAIPKTSISEEIIEGALGFIPENEHLHMALQIPMGKKKPRGDTLASQIQSLLPNNITEKERVSLTYALSRIVTQRVPRKVRWPIIPKGLDTLTAAILQLYIVSKSINQRIPWIVAIWSWKIRDAKIDTLESIWKELSENPSEADIESVFEEEDTKFKEAISMNPADNVEPFSQQIFARIKLLSAEKEKKEKEKEEKRKEKLLKEEKEVKEEKKKEKTKEELLQEKIADMKRAVRDLTAEIKGYSSALTKYSDAQSDSVTDWNLLALRADGPSSDEYHSLLRLLRKDFNILRYDPIRMMCINLAHNETPGHPTVEDLEQVSDFLGRNAYYEMLRLESLFDEHYILNLGKIGLRYRYIFTDLQRSGVKSDGLVEKLDFNEEQIRGCTIHIEPNLSQGPDMRRFSGDFIEAVAEHEIVTLNLNHFNTKTGDWLTAKQSGISDTKQKDSLLIQRSTITNDKQPFSPTAGQTDFLGLLWSLYGTRRQRKWLFDAVNYRQQTATRNLSVMLKNHVLRLLYLPVLELCKLPDGLVAYANCSDRKSRDRLVEHIIESQPFSRIHVGDTNDVVAHIRSPFKQSDTVAGDLKEKMREFSDNYLTARMQERKTYRITSFHRLLQPKTGTWKDPW